MSTPKDGEEYSGREYGNQFERLVFWATHSGWRYCDGLKNCGNETILKMSHFNNIVKHILKEVPREELEKELAELKEKNMCLNINCTNYENKANKLNDENIDLHEHNLGFIDQITEKEEVNRGLQNACKKWEDICEELKAENEGNKEIARARGEAINELQDENELLRSSFYDRVKIIEIQLDEIKQLKNALHLQTFKNTL